ncbi:MAG: fibrobacter succinogenes major paralogous domain-containing protein [Fibrobacterales bacterium]
MHFKVNNYLLNFMRSISVLLLSLMVFHCVFDETSTSGEAIITNDSDVVSGPVEYHIDLTVVPEKVTGYSIQVSTDTDIFIDSTNLETSIDSLFSLDVTKGAGSYVVVSYKLYGASGYLAQQKDSLYIEKNVTSDSIVVINGLSPNRPPQLYFTRADTTVGIEQPVRFNTVYRDDDIRFSLYLSCTLNEEPELVHIDPANKACIYSTKGSYSAVVELHDGFHIRKDTVIVEVAEKAIIAVTPPETKENPFLSSSSKISDNSTVSSVVSEKGEDQQGLSSSTSTSSAAGQVHGSSSGNSVIRSSNVAMSSATALLSSGQVGVSSVMTGGGSSSQTSSSAVRQIGQLIAECSPLSGGEIKDNKYANDIDVFSEVTLTALPKTGYSFKDWTANSADEVVFVTNVNEATVTVKLLKPSAKIFAHFLVEKYDVVVKISGVGEVIVGSDIKNDGDEFEVEHGDDVTIIANETNTAAYTWSRWIVPTGVELAKGETVKLNTVVFGSGGELTAVFTPNAFDIGVQSTHGQIKIDGGVTPGSYRYIYGDTVSIVVDTLFGWSFDKWNMTNVTVEDSDAVVAQIVALDETQGTHLLEAEYVANTYAITSMFNSARGTVAFTDNHDNYTMGAEKEVIATANVGWKFSHWVPANVTLTSNKSATTKVTSISQASYWEIKAEFLENNNLIALDSIGGNGKFYINGALYEGDEISFDLGNSIDLLYEPAPGYKFISWNVSGVTLNSYTTSTSVITGITQNSGLTLTAVLEDADTGIFRAHHGGVYDQSYSWKKYDRQLWMTENLNYTSQTGSYCSDCNTYGRLYDTPAILQGGVCPDGWKVPSDGEWKQLEATLGMSPTDLQKGDYEVRGIGVAKGMKSQSLWHVSSTDSIGTNSSEFNVLPAGLGFYSMGKSHEIGFFDATNFSAFWDNAATKIRTFNSGKTEGIQTADVSNMAAEGVYALSLRCLFNTP